MEEVKNAAFNLDSYKILSFSFKEAPESSSQNMRIEFDPKGQYNENDKSFVLELAFKAYLSLGDSEGEFDIVTAKLSSIFIFSQELLFNEIPTYFYRNALGIIFPYLRAFISTLTFQANAKLMILPLLNLTNLEKKLIDSVKVINKAFPVLPVPLATK